MPGIYPFTPRLTRNAPSPPARPRWRLRPLQASRTHGRRLRAVATYPQTRPRLVPAPGREQGKLSMIDILVLYYSRSGATAELARQACRGVESVAGAAAKLRT